MSEADEIDGPVDEALVRAREEELAAEQARRAIAVPGPMPAVAPSAAEPAVVAPSGREPRRPAPPSERVEEAVAAPARLAQGELVPGPDRAKIELNLPAEPDGPQAPEDIVVSEPFQKLPEARSRHAKTDLRMRPPVATSGATAADPAAAAPEAAAAAAASAGTRTVGGRTERLAPLVAGAEPGAAPEAADPPREQVAGLLAKTLGGRTERGLPPVVGAERGSGTAAKAAEASEASPWRDSAGGELAEELLPSSLMPGAARGETGSQKSSAAATRSDPPSSHAANAAAERRRNRAIVLGLLGLLTAGVLVLALLASGEQTDTGSIDVSTGRDAVAPAVDRTDTSAELQSAAAATEQAAADAGVVLVAPGSARPSAGPAARPSSTATTRAAASAGSSTTTRPATAPAPTKSSGSSGLFFEKGSN